MNVFRTIIAAAAISVVGGMSHAATLDCTDGGVELRKVDGVALDPSDYIDYDACFGPISGNDVGDKGTLLTNLDANWGDLGDWEILGKSDDAGSGVSADEDPTGVWSVLFDEAVSIFAVSIKSSNEYLVYLFDLSPDALISGMGFFAVYDEQDLSHMTIAYIPGTSEIPLPAAGWLLIAGLGGLAVMRRRKS